MMLCESSGVWSIWMIGSWCGFQVGSVDRVLKRCLSPVLIRSYIDFRRVSPTKTWNKDNDVTTIV